MTGIGALMLALTLPVVYWLWLLARGLRMMSRDAADEGSAGLIDD